MGRPPAFPVKKVVGFEKELLDAVDAWRREQSVLPNQSEAIRILLRDHLVGLGYLEPEK